jgi:hypothetical protein
MTMFKALLLFSKVIAIMVVNGREGQVFMEVVNAQGLPLGYDIIAQHGIY